MSTIIYHRGNLTSDQLRRECEAYTVDSGTRLTHLQAAKSEIHYNNANKFNQANYENVPLGTPRQKLLFIVIDGTIDDPRPEGNDANDYPKKIFDEILYLEDEEVRVVGFGNY